MKKGRTDPDFEKAVRAISSLQGNDHWGTIVAWIKASMHEAFLQSSLPKQDMAMYPFNAGRAHELSELYSTIKQARKIAEEFDKGRR